MEEDVAPVGRKAEDPRPKGPCRVGRASSLLTKDMMSSSSSADEALARMLRRVKDDPVVLLSRRIPAGLMDPEASPRTLKLRP